MAETRHMLPDWARSVLSLAFLFFVAFATAGNRLPLFIAIMVSAALAIVAIQLLFPVGRLFSIAFANLIAVYAAIFSLFAEEVFGGVDPALLSLGFSLPIFAFVAGCWFRREQVRAVVAHPALRSERRMLGAFLWLFPTFIVGGGVLLLSRVAEPVANSAAVLIGAMTLIGLIVFTVSRDVAIFLVDAGLLFEEFFSRIQRLVIPAFAFLTFYSLLIILFASSYHIISQYTGDSHFYVGGGAAFLELLRIDLFLHRQHQHRRLRRHRSAFEHGAPARLDRGGVRLHAALVRRVGAPGIYPRASRRSAPTAPRRAPLTFRLSSPGLTGRSSNH